ncbi:MAG: DUF3237 domain-containing protein [Dehalococcoidia bacterium]
MDGIPSEFLMDYRVDLAAVGYPIGATPTGERSTGGIRGGAFSGPRLRGVVEPFGDDWALVRPDDTLDADVHTVLRTDDDALIYLHYTGLIHPRSTGFDGSGAEVYWRMSMRFTTAAPKYDWMNRILAIALGRFEPTPEGRSAHYRVFEVK